MKKKAEIMNEKQEFIQHLSKLYIYDGEITDEYLSDMLDLQFIRLNMIPNYDTDLIFYHTVRRKSNNHILFIRQIIKL